MYNNFGRAIVIGGFITAFVLNGVAAYLTGDGGPCCPDEVRRLREAEGYLYPDDNGQDAIDNQNNRRLEECYCLGTESYVVNDEACPDCRSTSPTNVVGHKYTVYINQFHFSYLICMLIFSFIANWITGINNDDDDYNHQSYYNNNYHHCYYGT